MCKATYKETWKLDNTEGWKLYNKEMEKMENREKILGDRYETAETIIKKILKNLCRCKKSKNRQNKNHNQQWDKTSQREKENGEEKIPTSLQKRITRRKTKKQKYNTWKAKNNPERK